MQVCFKCYPQVASTHDMPQHSAATHKSRKQSKDKVPAFQNPIIDMRVDVRRKRSTCGGQVIRYLRLSLCNPLLMQRCIACPSRCFVDQTTRISVAICRNTNFEADFVIWISVLILVILPQLEWAGWLEGLEMHRSPDRTPKCRCWAAPLFEHCGYDINYGELK